METESSPINAPHPDDGKDEADLFFGDPEEQATETAPADPDPGAFDPESGTFVEPPADPTPPVESAGPTEEPDAPEPTPDPSPATSSDAAAPASGENGRTSGQLEREYLVFHKLPLTERALRFLLAEIEEGRAPEPRVAFFQVHRTSARNVKAAVGEAYAKHKNSIGEEVDLAAVSERAFQIKHVAPRQVVDTNIQIT